ncbi:(2Fe-2S)-binding protein [Nocardioides caldifontis]|uniref:(2Fe-2S)-binding protein n=1 Tax=Nocardioides caldifontis TaxID=2588938 RepID=UPI001396A845|nr:(2Fe-2S)-binding protein [Nocardioides caldifontis]
MIRQPFRRWRERTPGRRRSAALDRRTLVCPCHDATLFDLRNSWDEGYQHPETLKRATAVFMGPCQGKMCAKLVGNVVAELQGGGEPEQRRPSVRPPLFPVRMGDLVHEDEVGGGAA